MSWASALLESIKLRARYIWVLAASSGIVLFVPAPLSDWLRVGPLREKVGPVLGAVFVLSVLFAAVRTYDAFEESRTRQARRNNLTRRLQDLTPGEAKILLEARRKGHQTVFLPLSAPTPRALVQKELLEASAANAAPATVATWPHTIPDDVWGLLQANESQLEKRAGPSQDRS